MRPRPTTNALSRTFIHNLAFFRKEVLTVVRQPRLIFSLVLGPFLILSLFAIGYREELRTLKTLFVVPDGSPIANVIAEQASNVVAQIEVAGMTSDLQAAEQELRNQRVDVVVVAPGDPEQNWESNQQAPFLLYHYEIDPYEKVYVDVMGKRTTDIVNRRVLASAVDEAKAESEQWQSRLRAARDEASLMRQALESGNRTAAGQSAQALSGEMEWLRLAAGSSILLATGLQGAQAGASDGELQNRLAAMQTNLDAIANDQNETADLAAQTEQAAAIESELTDMDTVLSRFRATDTNVLVEPFTIETRSITDADVSPIDFYVPGVLALLMQHIAVSLAALSIIVERRSGAMELFRASPISALETLIGKYFSFFLFLAIVATALTALVVLALGVPMLGDWGWYALTLLAVIFSGLGIGFLISLGVKTESQAIQYSMIVLLASIFLGGFFLPLYRIWAPVRTVSWALPVTYGTTLLQSIMLRGRNGDPILIAGLVAMGLLLFFICWWRLRRQMRRE